MRSFLAALAVTGVLALACGAATPATTATSSPTPRAEAPTPAPTVAPTPAPTPARTPAPAVAAGPRVIEVEMGNYWFKPEKITLKAGEVVTLKFVNNSTEEHEFMAGQTVTMPHGYKTDLFHDVKVTNEGGTLSMGHESMEFEVHDGKTGSITFTVPDRKGNWEMGCFVPLHYEKGMKGTIVIE